MNSSKFDWVIDNIKNTTSQDYITFPKQKRTNIIEIEGIKIGIIGLVTVLTPSSTNTEMSDLEFDDYIKIINEESSKLKKSGVNAIIVIGHLGLSCSYGLNNEKLEYKLRNKNTNQTTCSETDEAFIE
jgi:2',3'-cyclic-nucleotide 2'-phosphodiesterase (5'-nucleotidase family)